MAILGVQNNGAGFTRSYTSTTAQRLVYDLGFILTYTADHVVTEVGFWLQSAPASSSTVQVGVYDISSGRVGAPLVYSRNITATSGSTAESYITVTGLSDALTGLSGGETLAFGVTYNAGDPWPGRRAPEDVSFGGTALNLADPWSESSTSNTESPDGYIVIESGGTPTPSITAPASVSPGETISFTASNFTPNAATVSDGTSTLSLTSITNTEGDNYTAVVPALPTVGNSLQYTTFGAVTLSATDGTGTAEDTTALSAATGQTVTILAASFDTSELSYLFNFGGTPATGDQFIEGNAALALDANGGYVADTDGTYVITGIDATDGIAQSYELIVGPGETPSVVGRLTRRNLTSRNLTRRSLTSRS